MRRASMRLRIAGLAVAIVGTALVAGGIGLERLLARTMVRNVDAETNLRADDVAALAARGPLPRVLPGGTEDANAVQVVDRHRQVVSQSRGIATRRAIASFVPPPDGRVVHTVHHRPIGDDGAAYRIVARWTTTPAGQQLVYAAGSLEAVEEELAVVRRLLVFGLPVLVVLVGVTAWGLVGRALRPVEDIRRQVAGISDAALDRRVPEPASGDEIARLARTMNEMLDRLERARGQQRAFVSDASHELRSPLATIRAQLEVALAAPEATDLQALARRVLAEQQRLERLVDDLLLLARSDETRAAPRHGLVDLDELVLREVQAVRARGQVTIAIDGVSGGRVVGDDVQLARVVRNLLDNAERHAAGRVAVEVQPRDGVVELVVTDDGPGIPAGEQSRIFERFTRLDGARSRDAGGTGLGLAIVADLVAAHGGTVAVDPTATGARLTVRLPAAGAATPS